MENVSKVFHFNNIFLESDAFDGLDDVIKFIATKRIYIRYDITKWVHAINDPIRT